MIRAGHTDLDSGGWRLLAEGAGFVEGPAARDGFVDFVSVNRGLVYRARLDGSGSEVLAELGGGPNGAAVDAGGRLWVVQNGGRVMESKSTPTEAGIQILGTDGSVDTVIGPALHAPNDCAFGPDGRLWFTDPYGRLMPPSGAGPQGRIWAYTPASGEFELVAANLSHPNGLCFTPDGARLYVSDTHDRSIVALEVDAVGVRRPELVAGLPEGMPDGMALDAEGRLWVAATTSEGIGVLGPDGRWEFIALGDSFPTNVCFAGHDLATMIVTVARGGRVIAREVPVPGVALFAP
jgi:gluconolactonase